MKTKILFAVSCGVGMLLSACNRYGPPSPMPELPPFYTESYIHAFMTVHRLDINLSIGTFKVDEKNKIIDPAGGRLLELNGQPANISDIIDLQIYLQVDNEGEQVIFDCANYFQDTNERCLEISRQYKALVQTIGDVSFDREIRNVNPLAESLLDTIRTVTVTCDKDFDAGHPVGSSLNDLFTVSFNDPHALIRNNYQTPAGMYRYPANECRGDYPYAVLLEKLSEVNFPDHPFLDYRWDCLLDKAPQTTDTYIFTVQVVLKDGTVLEASAALAIEGTN